MITIDKLTIQNIPMLHIVKDEIKQLKTPVIFFIHGFGSAKEHNLHYAYLLAEEGFRVILPEAVFHGERSEGMSEGEMNFHFWDIVINEINEIQVIKEELATQGLIDVNKIGVAGTSMGGIVTLGALTQYSWIHSAVSLMGSPYYEAFCKGQIEELKRHDVELPFTAEELEAKYEELRKYDLSLQPEKLNGRPLLFWHGQRDKVVPYQYTYDFYKNIQEDYQENKSNLRFITDTRADHKVSREGLLATVEWFKKHIIG